MDVATAFEQGMSLREMQKAETRARVVDAARALFSEKGYEAATIRDIARRAGVAPGSVFTTFASKTELLQEIIFRRYEEMLDDVIAAAATRTTGFGKIEASLRRAYEIELRELRLLAETIGASYRWTTDEEQENRLRIAPLFNAVSQFLQEAARAGEVNADADLALVADIIFSCYLRNFRRALFDNYDAAALGDLMASQLQMLREGVGGV